MSIAGNLENIRERIALAAKRSGRDEKEVSLVAVSKRKPLSAVSEAMAAGQVCFGENYLQDAIVKIEQIPEATWHFIGRIQSNKAKLIAQYFNVVETIDRIKIAQALERNLGDFGRSINGYVQVNIGREDQKAGVLPENVHELVQSMKHFSHLKLAGLMALPPYSDNPEHTRKYFRQLRELAVSLVEEKVVVHPLGLSMGMSGDFEVAVEEGATLVRVGTAIFGERD